MYRLFGTGSWSPPCERWNLFREQTNQNGGCFKMFQMQNPFFLAMEDDLSMLIDEADSKNTKKQYPML